MVHIGVQVKMTGSSPSLPPVQHASVCHLQYEALQSHGVVKDQGLTFTFILASVRLSMRVTPEYAAKVSGKDSRLLKMCSVLGRDHNPVGSGHCSAGNSTPVFWQTLAPPKMK